MKIQIIVLIIFVVANVNAQSKILKGHLINGKTDEPISNATLYIVGGDSEYQTTAFGQYRLDITKGIDAQIGDKIEIYIKHPIYGFHKKQIPILRDLRHDVVIEPNNIIKINGSVYDERTNDPIAGIEVAFISEEDLADLGNDLLTAKSDKFGSYSIIISKSLIGEQKYGVLKFIDEKGKYGFMEKVVKLRSNVKTKLSPKYLPISASNPVVKELPEYEMEPTKKEPIRLIPVNNTDYGVIDFNSGRGVKRYELRYSPNKNERGQAISSGTQVKILGKRKNENILWYEIDYAGQIGWIKAKYVKR